MPRSLVNEMVEAGMEAYRLAPNADPQITDLLRIRRPLLLHRPPGRQGRTRSVGQSGGCFYPIDGGDQYERALPIIKLLIEGNATRGKGAIRLGIPVGICHERL